MSKQYMSRILAVPLLRNASVTVIVGHTFLGFPSGKSWAASPMVRDVQDAYEYLVDNIPRQWRLFASNYDDPRAITASRIVPLPLGLTSACSIGRQLAYMCSLVDSTMTNQTRAVAAASPQKWLYVSNVGTANIA